MMSLLPLQNFTFLSGFSGAHCDVHPSKMDYRKKNRVVLVQSTSF